MLAPAFKTGDPSLRRVVGSTPIHLRHLLLACVIIAAFFTRVVDPLVFPTEIRQGRGNFGDTSTYVQLAKNIVAGHGFSTRTLPPYNGYTVRAPLYPIFLALVFKIFGEDYGKVRALQGLMGLCVSAAGCALFVRLFPKASWSSRLLVIALLFLNPFFVWVNHAVLPDTLAGVFLMAGMWTLLYKKLNSARAVVAGFFLGALSLTRPEFMLLPLAIVAMLWVFKIQRAPNVLLALIIGAVLTIAPWTLRNYRITQRFIPISEAGVGCSMLLGWAWSPSNYQGFFYFPEGRFSSEAVRQKAFSVWMNYFKRFSWEGDEARHLDRQMMDIALTEMKQQPLKVPKRALEHLSALWLITPYVQHIDQPRHETTALLTIAALLVGIFARRIPGRLRIFLLTPSLYLSAIMALLIPEARYFVLTLPFLFVLAVAALPENRKGAKDAPWWNLGA